MIITDKQIETIVENIVREAETWDHTVPTVEIPDFPFPVAVANQEQLSIQSYVHGALGKWGNLLQRLVFLIARCNKERWEAANMEKGTGSATDIMLRDKNADVNYRAFVASQLNTKNGDAKTRMMMEAAGENTHALFITIRGKSRREQNKTNARVTMLRGPAVFQYLTESKLDGGDGDATLYTRLYAAFKKRGGWGE